MDNTPDTPLESDATIKSAIVRFLAEYAPKLVCCRNRHDIKLLVARIEQVILLL